MLPVLMVDVKTASSVAEEGVLSYTHRLAESTASSESVQTERPKSFETVDAIHPSCPNIWYTTIVPRVLVYKVMQDFQHPQYRAASFLPHSWRLQLAAFWPVSL